MQRRFQKCLSHTLPLLVPIDVASVSLIEHVAGESVCVADKLGHSYSVDVKHLVVNSPFVIDNPETVSLLKSEKVYCPGIYVRK